jgi:HSP20 family protein
MTAKRRDVDDLRGEIQELFADLWQVPRYSGMRRGFRPQCDCFRTEEPPALHVIVELAGVERESVHVVVTGRILSISGTRGRPRVPGARYHQMEIEYGPFERRLDLGENVDPSRATASYEKGMLRIVLPLAAASRESRVSIEVTRQ